MTQKIHCQHAGKCPGCPLIRFAYEKQLGDKNKYLREWVKPLNAAAKLRNIIASPEIINYRSTAKLSLHEDPQGRRHIGIYKAGTPVVVHIPDCPVHQKEINEWVKRLIAVPASLPGPLYRHNKKRFQEGCLKFITIRTCRRTKETGIILSHTGISEENLRSWADQLPFKKLSLYTCLLSKENEQQVLNNDIAHLSGPPFINLDVSDFRFTLHPSVFFQANTSLYPSFIEEVTQNLEGDFLLDLFSGFGAYSLNRSTHFKKIILVDLNRFNLLSAQTTAQHHKINNLELYQTSCEEFLQKRLTPALRKQVSHIVLNPPRTGLSPAVVEQISRHNFPHLTDIKYVSCNPQTLRRDLGLILKALPLKIISLQPFDMFPHNDHIEIVAHLQTPGMTPSI